MVVLHLMRLVGERVSRYLLLTGELIDAQTAQQIGLVNRVVPGAQLLDAAVDCATKIALNAPQAEAKTKLLLRRFSGQAMGLQMTDYTAIPHLDSRLQLPRVHRVVFRRRRPGRHPQPDQPSSLRR
jgi:enoyl-CoA hydratase/carnithine racemase